MMDLGDAYRPRRMRQRDATRRLLQETHLSVDQLVMPLFVRPGRHVRAPIPAMPGQFQLSVDQLVTECQRLAADRVPAVLLFGLPSHKDEKGSESYAREGIVQQAARAVKDAVQDLVVITDVCLCAYTSHGHCGIVSTGARGGGRGKQSGHTRRRPLRDTPPTAW